MKSLVLQKHAVTAAARLRVECRSSYFRLGRLLGRQVPCRAVLALTATATQLTRNSIRKVLNIPEEGLFLQGVLPPNLRLQVHRVPPGEWHLSTNTAPTDSQHLKLGRLHAFPACWNDAAVCACARFKLLFHVVPEKVGALTAPGVQSFEFLS